MTGSPSPVAGFSSLPSSSTIFAEMPGSAVIAEPGLHIVTPGSGAIIAAPVSVCHQVSTIGTASAPNTSGTSAMSGLMGSPTDPRRRRLDRSWAKAMSRPHFMNALKVVGVIDCHTVLFDDLEMPVLVRRSGCSLVDHLGSRRSTVGRRRCRWCSGNPADIGCAPIDVASGLMSNTLKWVYDACVR